MTRLLLIVSLLAVVCFSVQGQAEGVPKFSAYQVSVEKAKAKSIDFKKNPEARTFRTRLSEALRNGVNFAGHFVIAGWGCGTGCVSGAIIDARTGSVFWPEQFNAFGVLYGDGNYADPPVEYKTNSRLLIIHGIPGEATDDAPSKPAGDYYYEWKNDRLHQIKFIPRSME